MLNVNIINRNGLPGSVSRRISCHIARLQQSDFEVVVKTETPIKYDISHMCPIECKTHHDTNLLNINIFVEYNNAVDCFRLLIVETVDGFDIQLSGNLVISGFYYILENYFGIVIFHPFDTPYYPSRRQILNRLARLSDSLTDHCAKWKIRRWHIHTQHPLELTEFLNGIVHEEDRASFSYDMQKFTGMLEWLHANMQESLEWIPLVPLKESLHNSLEERVSRWRIIVQLCNDFHIRCGLDIPLSLIQQHSWTLTSLHHIDSQRHLNATEGIAWNIDFFMGEIGFHFISTEIGSTEFTATSCDETIALLNFAVSYMNSRYGALDLPVKIHISSGQYCNIGKVKLNFNFLPSIAADSVTLMPHTVQIPSLLNCSSQGVYGTSSFEPLYEFIADQLTNNSHRIIWYPESAYWVNYDIDVPLFLPVYMLTRLRDISNLSMLEQQKGNQLAGQMLFESGWEWGYWLQNAVIGRMSFFDVNDCEEFDALRFFMKPFLDIFDDDYTVRISIENVLIELILLQQRYLLAETSIIGFLVGKETWSDITQMISAHLATTPMPPVNIRMLKLRKLMKQVMPFIFPGLYSGPNVGFVTRLDSFAKELDDLLLKLAGLEYRFTGGDSHTKMSIYYEIRDSVAILLYRTKFVYKIYQSTSFTGEIEQLILLEAENIILKADLLVRNRMSQYRFPANRIASWNENNPTCYNFMYLWAVKTLYYWRRDLEIAKCSPVRFRCISPCFMNIIDPVDTVLGRGMIMKLKTWVSRILRIVSNCLYAPSVEPVIGLF